MIRPAQRTDMDALVSIWLTASLTAHDFITDSYWREQQSAMKDVYLPQACTLVAEDRGEICGFVSLMDSQVAALFVDQERQGKGYGKQLLEWVQNEYSFLSLQVYVKNEQAIQFYKRFDFQIVSEQMDDATGEREYVMEWKKAAE
ncbi:N-acetyltransferase [Alkalihalobacillus sp. FSL R5-0424]